jgi:GT2 family glycosyltransferase
VLTIIVISYNTRELTLAAIKSALAETRRTMIEVIVVDNASSDGSADAIAEEFGGRIRFIRSPENLGFAGANNLAAREAKGSRLLLLNPDTVVLEGAIDQLSEFADANPAARIWGGRTVFEDGSLNASSCWNRPTLLSAVLRAAGLSSVPLLTGALDPEGIGRWKRDTVREVDIVSGCFCMIDKPLWDQLGGFDETFFMYGEDADLCLRARRLGARPLICPDAQIVHYGGKSERLRADKIVRLYKARMQLIARHMPPWQRPVARCLQRMNVLRRLVTWSLAGVLRTGPDRQGSIFSEVWRRRSEWLVTEVS